MHTGEVIIEGITSFRCTDIHINQKAGEHGRFWVEGYVDDEEAEKIRRMADKTRYVTVKAADNKLFTGLVYEFEIKHMPHDTFIHLGLISSSIKLDQTKKTRTFQNDAMTFGQIIMHIATENGASISINGEDAPIGSIVVQYEETDWEFIKRLASNIKERVFPQPYYEDIVIDVGISTQGATYQVPTRLVTYKNELFRLRQDQNITLSEADVEGMSFSSTDNLKLSDKAEVDRSVYYIYEMEATLNREDICYQYHCRRKTGMSCSTYRNKGIIGVSLDGRVSAVKGTYVQIALDVDANNPICSARDFSYATIYSSSSGTGWYCMPEIGDAVRLYFPSDYEKNGYVISSVHLNVEGDNSSGARTDPSVKSISNAYNKAIIFAPTYLKITNNNGMSIELDDETGIVIDSEKPVYIHSDSNIELNAADSIYLNGGNELRLEQEPEEGGDSCSLDLLEGKVKVEGIEFRIQENG